MIESNAVWKDILAIRERSPLVHNITNYVVMNSTANALLAIGASPVMAHAIEEVQDIVGIAAKAGGALVINIGTLSDKWIEAMKSAMHAAKAAGVPIVFDPVGAGASTFRSWTCKKLLNAAHPAVIRGNASEIMALLDSGVQTKGVDSSESSDAAVESASAIAERYKCVVSVSGETDIITDGSQVLRIHNGHLMMTRVTGLGCTASALTGAFTAINPNPLHAAAHAMAVMGIAGELAVAKSAGPGTLQLHFYDALYNLTQEQIETMLR